MAAPMLVALLEHKHPVEQLIAALAEALGTAPGSVVWIGLPEAANAAITADIVDLPPGEFSQMVTVSANEGAHDLTTDLELARELAPRLGDRVLGSAEGDGLSQNPYAWLLVTPEREVWLVYLEHDPGETVTLSPNGRRRWPLVPEDAST